MAAFVLRATGGGADSLQDTVSISCFSAATCVHFTGLSLLEPASEQEVSPVTWYRSVLPWNNIQLLQEAAKFSYPARWRWSAKRNTNLFQLLHTVPDWKLALLCLETRERHFVHQGEQGYPSLWATSVFPVVKCIWVTFIQEIYRYWSPPLCVERIGRLCCWSRHILSRQNASRISTALLTRLQLNNNIDFLCLSLR